MVLKTIFGVSLLSLKHTKIQPQTITFTAIHVDYQPIDTICQSSSELSSLSNQNVLLSTSILKCLKSLT